jgi:hypothetical protein
MGKRRPQTGSPSTAQKQALESVQSLFGATNGGLQSRISENPFPDTIVSYKKSSKNQKRRAWRWGFHQLRRWGKPQQLGQTPIGNHPNSFRQIWPFNTACQARRCASSVAW